MTRRCTHRNQGWARMLMLRDCDRCITQRRAERAVEERRLADIDWYVRTGHCGSCGNPGRYCTCTTQCGCHELHPVGSGLDPDALNQFTIPTSQNQEELF